MEQHYYKFRSLQNLKRFIDIILNERLYASRYDELNDPMEGVYLTNPSNGYIIQLLRAKKYKTKICSLSEDYRHTLLWSHYADGHTGCCIEVSAVNEREQPTTVRYIENIPVVNDMKEGKELLSHKSIVWEYEKEVRYFRKTSYLHIRIHKIIFGLKVSEDDYRFYEKLIHAINPTIEIRRINKEEIEYGYI
ncbi:DUF2971 domain-containing protein [Prevotella sp. HCN-7019]|uniref:DUF2971 domain-containing protein n=1 Tax=Prevotella sp. HCN-7019 TaxID=3134668 RepID=UPI0030BE7D6D